MRLLILILILYLCYRAIKSKLFTPPSHNSHQGQSMGDNQTDRIDDIMVKDPYCDMYFPQREGIHIRHMGQDLYFCSKECRDKFLAERTKH